MPSADGKSLRAAALIVGAAVLFVMECFSAYPEGARV
jgi:hypothetical protein